MNNITPENYILEEAYLDLPDALINAIENDNVYFLVELYHPSNDDIFWHPERAMFRWAEADIRWSGVKYKGKIKEIPTLKTFIGKQFNEATLDLLNVVRGSDSPSFIVLNNVIRGFRVSIRIVFDGAKIEDTRLVWWGRLDSVKDIKDETVRLHFSQELGNFSYEVATDKYQQSCPLQFGKGQCLGTETFEEKSPLYQTAFNNFGQGGCNKTFDRCRQFNKPNSDSQERFYQGQRQVIKEGYFNRVEYVKRKFLWFNLKGKEVRVPVKYSVNNQDSNSDDIKPIVIGRAYIEGQPFTWADVGTQIHALIGFAYGGEAGIDSFNSITSLNPDFPITSFTKHLGTLGGVGTQFPDGRFPESGYNSALAFLGVTFGGSQPDDTPDDLPAVSAVLKGMNIPVLNRDTFEFETIWTHNPVWITRKFLTIFRYTVIPPAWFNERANLRTADYCYTVIEDDTNSDIAIISNNEAVNAQYLNRYNSASRYNEYWERYYDNFQSQQVDSLSSGGETQNLLPFIDEPSGDIIWFPILTNPSFQVERTFLAFRYTLNGYVGETTSISDLMYSLVLPTFRGFFHFNPYGQMEIQCRKPAPNAFVREDEEVGNDVIPVTNVKKLFGKGGYLLIGVGKLTAEIGEEKGAGYVNGCLNTEVSCTTTGSLDILSSDGFSLAVNKPSEISITFNGSPTAGELIKLTFSDNDGEDVLEWDYAVLATGESLDVVAKVFKARLEASPSFNEYWSAEIPTNAQNTIIIKCQTGFLKLKEPLLHPHFAGEEILRVVEVYENNKDETNPNGLKDNLYSASFNEGGERFHAATAKYVSAIDGFKETEIIPRVVWESVEQERNLNLLKLDLRYVDNYRQAAFITKSNRIDFVNGAFYGTIEAGLRSLFHNENDVIAVRYQTLEGVSYLPMTINDFSFNRGSLTNKMSVKLYLSAAFDERVAKEEKFLETTLTSSPDINIVPPPVLSTGGFSTGRTGDGNADSPQNIKNESAVIEILPSKFHTKGRDTI